MTQTDSSSDPAPTRSAVPTTELKNPFAGMLATLAGITLPIGLLLYIAARISESKPTSDPGTSHQLALVGLGAMAVGLLCGVAWLGVCAVRWELERLAASKEE